jgi:hypothetical protein
MMVFIFNMDRLVYFHGVFPEHNQTVPKALRASLVRAVIPCLALSEKKNGNNSSIRCKGTCARVNSLYSKCIFI